MWISFIETGGALLCKYISAIYKIFANVEIESFPKNSGRQFLSPGLVEDVNYILILETPIITLLWEWIKRSALHRMNNITSIMLSSPRPSTIHCALLCSTLHFLLGKWSIIGFQSAFSRLLYTHRERLGHYGMWSGELFKKNKCQRGEMIIIIVFLSFHRWTSNVRIAITVTLRKRINSCCCFVGARAIPCFFLVHQK